MQMRSRRIARAPDLRDDLSRLDDLPRRHVQSTAMGVARVRINRGMINQNLVAVAVVKICGDNNLSVEKRADIFSVIVAKINARMKFPLPRNRMNSPAERRSHGKINRLNLRGQNYQRDYQCPNLFQTL